MPESEWISHSADETTAWGRELGARLKPPLLVLLTGELGSGKTTLTKGLVAGLGAAREEDVTSPTFTLVHVFQNRGQACPERAVPVRSAAEGSASPREAPGPRVYHVDLYRVGDFHDLETLGLEDVLAEPAVVIVEWAEKFSLRTDWPVVRIRLEHLGADSRRIVVVDPSGILGSRTVT